MKVDLPLSRENLQAEWCGAILKLEDPDKTGVALSADRDIARLQCRGRKTWLRPARPHNICVAHLHQICTSSADMRSNYLA